MSNQASTLCRCSGGRRIVFIALLLFTAMAVAQPAGYIETDVEWQKIQLGTNARQTWDQNRPANYVYDLTRECDCPHRAVRVFVLSGRVARVEDLESREVITEEVELRKFRSLDEMNEWLDHLWRRGADAFMVRRNSFLGYPEEIDIDPTYRMIGEEIQEKVVRFRLLKKMK